MDPLKRRNTTFTVVGSDGEGTGPMNARRNTGEVPILPEYRAAQQITPQTWALIIALIVTLTSWGATSYATSKQLDRKADREVIELQLRQMQEDIKDIKTDVREMRRQGGWNGNGNGNGNQGRYVGPSNQ